MLFFICRRGCREFNDHLDGRQVQGHAYDHKSLFIQHGIVGSSYIPLYAFRLIQSLEISSLVFRRSPLQIVSVCQRGLYVFDHPEHHRSERGEILRDLLSFQGQSCGHQRARAGNYPDSLGGVIVKCGTSVRPSWC